MMINWSSTNICHIWFSYSHLNISQFSSNIWLLSIIMINILWWFTLIIICKRKTTTITTYLTWECCVGRKTSKRINRFSTPQYVYLDVLVVSVAVAVAVAVNVNANVSVDVYVVVATVAAHWFVLCFLFPTFSIYAQF